MKNQNASALENSHEEDMARREKSELLAAQLPLIHGVLFEHDMEFIREAGHDMCNNANRMDSAAPLIRNYSPLKSQLLATQGKAMLLLSEYMKTVKECSELKAKICTEEQHHQHMNQIFGI